MLLCGYFVVTLCNLAWRHKKLNLAFSVMELDKNEQDLSTGYFVVTLCNLRKLNLALISVMELDKKEQYLSTGHLLKRLRLDMGIPSDIFLIK